jgi:hypothetical protein
MVSADLRFALPISFIMLRFGDIMRFGDVDVKIVLEVVGIVL